MRFLLFTHYAPMTAHGEVAVGERRMGWDRPSRSAIIGLVAAAMGIDRADDKKHQELDAGVWYAVRTDAGGRPFTDYHTTQVPGTQRKRRFATRREELAAENLNTILSVREWRADALYTVALWRRDEGKADLDAIVAALERPFYTLYGGRKAGPLGWPPSPRLVEAATLVEALRADPMSKNELLGGLLGILRAEKDNQPLAFDADAVNLGVPQSYQIVVRRDRIVSRRTWQFAERREGMCSHWEAGS